MTKPGRARGGAATGGKSPPPPIRRQVSAGGVTFRQARGGPQIAIIRPRGTERWQLPKGLIDPGESPEQAARREVREETGVDGDVVAPLETVEYWYVGTDRDGARVRFHKTVHFFLLSFRAGDVRDHDHEVEDARWIAITDALERLAFKTERSVVARASEMIATFDTPAP